MPLGSPPEPSATFVGIEHRIEEQPRCPSACPRPGRPEGMRHAGSPRSGSSGNDAHHLGSPMPGLHQEVAATDLRPTILREDRMLGTSAVPLRSSLRGLPELAGRTIPLGRDGQSAAAIWRRHASRVPAEPSKHQHGSLTVLRTKSTRKRPQESAHESTISPRGGCHDLARPGRPAGRCLWFLGW